LGGKGERKMSFKGGAINSQFSFSFLFINQTLEMKISFIFLSFIPFVFPPLFLSFSLPLLFAKHSVNVDKRIIIFFKKEVLKTIHK
jgi:hypothetical protein